MTGNLLDQAVLASRKANEERLRYLTELAHSRSLSQAETRELDRLTARLRPETATGGKLMAANAERGQQLKLDGETPPERRFCKTVAEASKVLGVSRRTLYNYREDGLPWKEKGARFFDLMAMWRWLYRRENGEPQTPATSEKPAGEGNGQDSGASAPAAAETAPESSEAKRQQRIADRAELEKEKLRRQNRKLELETKRLEKELVSRALVEEQQVEKVATVKKGLFLLVDQLPPLIVNCGGDEAKIRQLLQEGVIRLLAAYSRPIEM